ncbi:hypothetical protein GWI33_012854 [Rhynchophorus ferrugineus]|uniref:Uncharacterized protein n=1 Tax=Rhynchophorus ferrugineus TaxID=354439 RepID=A0A834I5R8_RHYFE|nr:hypothetical protein GWI33_012854 [Rhynchophorus ferrugineus]
MQGRHKKAKSKQVLQKGLRNNGKGAVPNREQRRRIHEGLGSLYDQRGDHLQKSERFANPKRHDANARTYG